MDKFNSFIDNKITSLKEHSLYKEERIIATPQAGKIRLSDGRELLNFCANNYLGLADDKRLIECGTSALKRYGYGMASVRFICGTQEDHKELEEKISSFLKMEDTILYSSCFDANTGLFETILDENDAIISDALNHASIIDGVRLCKAKRFRYANNDMADLEEKLMAANVAGARFKLIVTDGVFSMDGIIANLQGVCDLAEKYDALVMVDDSHAVGVIGESGRGSIEYCGVQGRVDIITGTLGKALGGASGGYVSANAKIVDWLRQASRPYLFSNSLAPMITKTSIMAFEIVENGKNLRAKLNENTLYFYDKMTKLGFEMIGSLDHAIAPVLLKDAEIAQEMARMMMEEGIYVIGFFYPVVPKGLARIRTQMSAAHSKEDIDILVAAFEKTGRGLGVIK